MVTGNKRAELIQNVCDAQVVVFQKPELKKFHTESFAYYPETWISPYIDLRRANGWGLYGLLNIQKGDKEKMETQQLRNYQLFDAPVGLFFTVDKAMGTGSKNGYFHVDSKGNDRSQSSQFGYLCSSSMESLP